MDREQRRTGSRCGYVFFGAYDSSRYTYEIWHGLELWGQGWVVLPWSLHWHRGSGKFFTRVDDTIGGIAHTERVWMGD